MLGARPWLRSESIRSFIASEESAIIPPSPVVSCLFA